ncbi:MAG: hypothetical protein SFV15_16755 [Polyangiaceae bacterium]|nr:hypothetical protein [Polyangiaceae bacterium]
MNAFTGSPRQNLAMQIADACHEVQTIGIEMRRHANKEVVSVDPNSRAQTQASVYAGLLRLAQLILAIAMKLGKLEGSRNNA